MKEFDIMMKDEVIAHVKYDSTGVIIKQFVDFPFKQFYDDNISKEELLEWVEERCFPRTRHNAQELLEYLGLEFYDPWAIIEKTHGLIIEDYYWIRFKGEDLNYDDIKIRD